RTRGAGKLLAFDCRPIAEKLLSQGASLRKHLTCVRRGICAFRRADLLFSTLRKNSASLHKRAAHSELVEGLVAVGRWGEREAVGVGEGFGEARGRERGN